MIFSKPLYYITNVKDHKNNKDRILSLISKINSPYPNANDPEEGYYSYISNTDYTLRRSTWFGEAFSDKDKGEYLRFVFDKFQERKISISFAWFNQYYEGTGSEHTYHTHYCEEQPNDLANVYYVQLEDKSLRTILKHPVTGKEIVPRVKEGQILTFDAKIEHRSPRNFTRTQKTVISFNTKFL